MTFGNVKWLHIGREAICELAYSGSKGFRILRIPDFKTART
jgi:hypothetical protein